MRLFFLAVSFRVQPSFRMCPRQLRVQWSVWSLMEDNMALGLSIKLQVGNLVEPEHPAKGVFYGKPEASSDQLWQTNILQWQLRNQLFYRMWYKHEPEGFIPWVCSISMFFMLFKIQTLRCQTFLEVNCCLSYKDGLYIKICMWQVCEATHFWGIISWHKFPSFPVSSRWVTAKGARADAVADTNTLCVDTNIGEAKLNIIQLWQCVSHTVHESVKLSLRNKKKSFY